MANKLRAALPWVQSPVREGYFSLIKNVHPGSYSMGSRGKSHIHLLLSAVAQRLRRKATNRKVAGLIPDGVIGIFHLHNPSCRTMALGSNQPLTEMSKGRK
jgi:hypothetical protein